MPHTIITVKKHWRSSERIRALNILRAGNWRVPATAFEVYGELWRTGPNYFKSLSLPPPPKKDNALRYGARKSGFLSTWCWYDSNWNSVFSSEHLNTRQVVSRPKKSNDNEELGACVIDSCTSKGLNMYSMPHCDCDGRHAISKHMKNINTRNGEELCRGGFN